MRQLKYNVCEHVQPLRERTNILVSSQSCLVINKHSQINNKFTNV